MGKRIPVVVGVRASASGLEAGSNSGMHLESTGGVKDTESELACFVWLRVWRFGACCAALPIAPGSRLAVDFTQVGKCLLVPASQDKIIQKAQTKRRLPSSCPSGEESLSFSKSHRVL